jgi:hypothetical protein
VAARVTQARRVSSFWVVAATSIFGCSYFTGALGFGLISVNMNRTKPTPRTKRFGLALGVVNVLHAIGVAGILYMMTQRPPDPRPGWDVVGFIALGGVIALGLGIGGIVYAARARP